MWMDIRLSDEIFDHLKQSRNTLVNMIEAVEKFGYFDAHHEPMTNFLEDQEGKLEINPKVFLLQEMDQMSREIFKIQNAKLE